MPVFSLPIETLCDILDYFDPTSESTDLLSLCITHSIFRSVAQPRLFRSVHVRSADEAISACRAIVDNSNLGPMVRSFRCEVDEAHPERRSSELLSGLKEAFVRMRCLRQLELALYGKCGWILDAASFQLEQFDYDAAVDSSVISFLFTQTRLLRLSLSSADPQVTAPLLRSAALSLVHLSTLKCSWELAADILPERSVRDFHLAGIVGRGRLSEISPLLGEVSRRLQRLSLESPERPSDLLPILACIVPSLSELRLSLSGCAHEDESIQRLQSEEVMLALRRFTSLRCLRIEAFLHQPDTETARLELASAMGVSCPTLECVSLGFFPRLYTIERSVSSSNGGIGLEGWRGGASSLASRLASRLALYESTFTPLITV